MGGLVRRAALAAGTAVVALALAVPAVSAWSASAPSLPSHKAVAPQPDRGRSSVPPGLRTAVLETLSAGSELKASDGGPGSLFGTSVAVSGSIAVVGAPGQGIAGTAYVFVRSGTGWAQQAELTPGGVFPGDLFGDSVAISGTTVVVGAPNSTASQFPSPGQAYVFVRSSTTPYTWSQQAQLNDPLGQVSDNFGASVAVSGTTAVVGAPGTGPVGPVGPNGAAWVFVRSSTTPYTWSQQAQLPLPDPEDSFGTSVAISGSTAVIGAPGYPEGRGTGAAYVFGRSGTAWSQHAQLTAPDGTSGDSFGESVAVSGTTAVVGAPGHDSGTGAAYPFLSALGSWIQQPELTASDGAAGDLFGESVAVSASSIVVGAPGHISGTGAAYVWAPSSLSLSQQPELTASDGAAGDAFGHSVAASGTIAVVGAPGHISSTGVAYSFTTP